ncbi:protein GET1 [Phytophthora cinnamomi]|uniref:protein GET1 n=1 Tax=Phytophthora cinnamomi TaxID=4785 RepID=UPI00355A9C83|nr:protein GET1 [Phytophthora cinnamomi]
MTMTMAMELPAISALKVYDVLLIAAVVFAVDLAMKLWSSRGAVCGQKLLGEYNAQMERLAASAPSELQKQFDRIRTPVLMGLAMLYYWNEPLVVLPQGYMLPVERLMAFPGFPLGAISAVGWAGICRRVSSNLSAR